MLHVHADFQVAEAFVFFFCLRAAACAIPHNDTDDQELIYISVLISTCCDLPTSEPVLRVQDAPE